MRLGAWIVCMITDGHKPTKNEINHFVKIRILDPGDEVRCIFCDKLLTTIPLRKEGSDDPSSKVV